MEEGSYGEIKMFDCLFCSKTNICIKYFNARMEAYAKYDNGPARHDYVINKIGNCTEYKEIVI